MIHTYRYAFFLDSSMDRDELRVFCDLPDRRTDSEGTVPEELLSPAEIHNLASNGGSRGTIPPPDIVFLSRSFR